MSSSFSTTTSERDCYLASEISNLKFLKYWQGVSLPVHFPNGLAVFDELPQPVGRYKRQRIERKNRQQDDCTGLCQLELSQKAVSVFQDISEKIVRATAGGTKWFDISLLDLLLSFLLETFKGVVMNMIFEVDVMDSHLGFDRLEKHKIKFYMYEFDHETDLKQAKNDEMSNINASIQLEEGKLWTPLVELAVIEVIDKLKPLVSKKYQKYLDIQQLIALQPNIQPEPKGINKKKKQNTLLRNLSTASHLNLHVDQPRYEGFGVIIVTIAIQGSGTIVLLDEKDEPNLTNKDKDAWSFNLEEGFCYALTGDARNKCMHGVLPNGERSSLNLRFGLHEEDGEISFKQEFDRHWK